MEEANNKQEAEEKKDRFALITVVIIGVFVAISLISGASNNNTNPTTASNTNSNATSTAPSSQKETVPVAASNQSSNSGQAIADEINTQVQGTVLSLEMNAYIILKTDNGNKIIALPSPYEVSELDIVPGDKISVFGFYKGTVGGFDMFDPDTYPSAAILNLPDTTRLFLTEADKDSVISRPTESNQLSWYPVTSFSVNTQKSGYDNSPAFNITGQRWRINWTANYTDPFAADFSSNYSDYVPASLFLQRIRNIGDATNDTPTYNGMVSTSTVNNNDTISGTDEGFGSGSYLLEYLTSPGLSWEWTVEELR